jgi:hypothetical protein
VNLQMKLARPLWLPPRGFITAEFQHRGLIQDNITAQVGIAGRILLDKEPAPRKLFVPYVSHWASKVFDMFGTNDTDSSTENDLINPFDVPLHVQRFVRHMSGFRVASASNFDLDDAFGDIHQNLMQVRIISSDGSPTIPVFSTVGTVFPRMTRSWECEHEVAPGGYYLAYLNKLSPANQTVDAIRGQEFYGMVGYREEAQ